MLTVATAYSAEPVATKNFIPPAPPSNLEELGENIQRTMTLLATSTPQKRNHVHILFYGQSVTAGRWTKAVTENLRKAYPNADIEIENRAIGGYSAPTLLKTAEYDLYPFYPDLMIFHVYGGVESGELEKIIAHTRQRTTAEILFRTPHFRWPKDLARDGSPDDPAAKGLCDADEKQSKLIRELSAKYGCELAEVREQLRSYFKANNLFPKDTLGDSVHPNDLGNFLLEKLVMQYLRYDPKFPKNKWRNMVRDVAVDDAKVKRGADGSIELTFEGNRIDVIADNAKQEKAGTAKVLIDNKPPSEYPELYYHSRPSASPHVWWPAINKIGFEKQLVLESWTAKILECDPEKKVLTYEVIGSKTGPDGKGDQNKKFVSNSGRVVIDSGMWSVCGALSYRKKELPKNYEVKWEVKPLFVDVYSAPTVTDPTKENTVTLAQGLSNTQHTLKLVPNGDGPLSIKLLRIYQPPLAETTPESAK